MDLELFAHTIQKYLENVPLVILGSGASAAYGLPTMKMLADEIESHRGEIADPQFADFCTQMNSYGLEEALDRSALLSESKSEIRRIIWKIINECDLKFLANLKSADSFPLAKLFSNILTATPSNINVITTNYDRLPEYAADLIHATAITGFEGALIRYQEDEKPSVNKQRISARERVVNILKVHGSLDWFQIDGNILSYPLSKDIWSNSQPVIIPPGREKYYETHEEPYRSIIAKADSAFRNASCYLCIGYGFNDAHIQPILLREIHQNKPIVILTYKMTDASRRYLMNSDVKKKIIVECEINGKTKITSSDEEILIDGDLWKLEEFINKIF